MGDEIEGGGLVDIEALKAILEQATDVLRPLGLTVMGEAQIMVQETGEIMALLPLQIRTSAKKKLTEDRDAKEAFNRMMAEQHQAQIDEKTKSIRSALSDFKAFQKFMDGEELDEPCEHKNMHPSGFCMDCNDGMDDDFNELLK